MMYKFRGRTFEGNWKYGYYFAKPIIDAHYILQEENQWMVEKKTVGMFSGFTDKNKHDLYEGDVVSYKLRKCCPGIPMVVAFKCGQFYLGPIETPCHKIFTDKCPNSDCDCPIFPIRFNTEAYGFKNMELIGNVFDGPEFIPR